MKKIIVSLVGSLSLAGCVVAPYPAYDEPETVVAVGYYDPGFGYWTGYGWDFHYYEAGHAGYGHPVYRGPRSVRVSHPRVQHARVVIRR